MIMNVVKSMFGVAYSLLESDLYLSIYLSIYLKSRDYGDVSAETQQGRLTM